MKHVEFQYQMLYCKECGRPIAHKGDLFSLSVVGPQGTYVNPGGYVHETITVLRAKNVQDVTSASKEHSWFPGYESSLFFHFHVALVGGHSETA